MDLSERSIMVRECSTHGTNLGLPILGEGGMAVRCGHCGTKLEAVEYVPATRRRAVDSFEVERLREALESIALLDPSVPSVDPGRPIRIARQALAVADPKWQDR